MTLLNLKAAQQSLISDINFRHSSFIRDIPNEIVRLIFTFCHDPTPRRNKKSQSRGFCMLRLGAVCQKWREIAWATPEFWTTLRMPDIPKGSSPSFSLQVELAQEWLFRTANLPLNISLETQESSEFNHDVGSNKDPQILLGALAMSRYLHPGMYFNLPLFHYLPSEALQNESYSQKFQHLRLDGFQLRKSPVSFNAYGELLKPTKA